MRDTRYDEIFLYFKEEGHKYSDSLGNSYTSVSKRAGDIPSLLKKLEEAKQNLMYEKETEVSRGGQAVLSSMDAEDYS